MAPASVNLCEAFSQAAVSRGSAAIAPFALIYILLPAMGEHIFGAWLTIASLTGMMVWADLGLGNGFLPNFCVHWDKMTMPVPDARSPLHTPS